MSLAAPLQGPVSMNLPFAPTSAGDVRRALVSWLENLGSPRPVIDDATLVVTELVANAIRHADPLSNDTVLVRWQQVGSELVLSVTDGGGGGATPRRVDAAPEAESGRGLAIVEALSLDWQIEHPHGLTLVSVRLPLQ